MAGLILKLRPNEQLLINGVILENGDRKTKLRVKTEGAHILRLRDAIRPEDATTPLKRAYYIAQLAVAGQLSNGEAASMLQNALADFGGDDPAMRDEIDCRIAENDYYKVMRTLSAVMNDDRSTPSQGTC